MSKISQNLQSAINNLEIKNIFINRSVAEHVNGDPLFTDFENVFVDLSHQVKKSVVFSDTENKKQLLRIYISFGVKWKEEQYSDEILSQIAVEYILEYDLKKELSKDCIDEFALKNSMVHVWPYWREYVGSLCDRLSLPKIILPTMQLKHHARTGNFDNLE